MVSPSKNSPLIAVYANRPSTILEVSSSNKITLSSYRTAMTNRSVTDSSEYFKTADEGSETLEDFSKEFLTISKPKLRSFYETNKNQIVDLTKDLLENETNEPSSSVVESSYEEEENASSDKMDDTLERIDFTWNFHMFFFAKSQFGWSWKLHRDVF
jgi:hypothetical protein